MTRRTDCHVRAVPFLAMTVKSASASKKNGQAIDTCHCEEAQRATFPQGKAEIKKGR